MRKTLLRGSVSLLLVLIMLLGSASAWEQEWEYDEDLSAYKLCDNFGDIQLKFAVTLVPAVIDWDTNEFVKWLEEVTNVDLVFEQIPLEGRAEKLSLLLASGDYPDVFLSVGMTDQQITTYGVGEGLFLPLNDLIAEYGNFTDVMLEEYPGALGNMTQMDGNIYSLPEVNECYHCSLASKFWINETWLANLGLETPTTLDELYNVLVAFRDQDANGNGDPSDEIPLSGDYVGWFANPERFIMSAFTYYNLDLNNTATTSQYAFGLYLDGDQVVTPFALDEFKDGIEYVRKLVEEGILYEGSFTQDDNTLTQLVESGVVGATNGGYFYFATLGGDVYRQYDVLMPVVGPDGYQSTMSRPHDSVSGNVFTISTDCENPEAAFMIGDLLYSYAASMRSYYGVYGENWTDADEGAVGINGKEALYKLLTPWSDTEPQNYCVLQMTTSRRDADFRLGEPSDPEIDLHSASGLETLLYNTSKEMEAYADHSKALPPVKFSEEENAELAIIKADLSTAIKEGMFAFFTGSKNTDTDYDAWLADLENKGLSRLEEIYQTAYDRQYK